MSAVNQEQAMRYEPSVNERAVPRSRQTAELDIWEDEGGATSKRATRDPGRKVDSKVDRPGEWHCRELSS